MTPPVVPTPPHTPLWIKLIGVGLLVAAGFWATVEYKGHQTIHLTSAIFIFSMTSMAVALFAGVAFQASSFSNLTSALRDMAAIIREYKRPANARTREHDIPPNDKEV